jgi:hypothetical protein
LSTTPIRIDVCFAGSPAALTGRNIGDMLIAAA